MAAAWLLARAPSERKGIVDRANDIPDFFGNWATRAAAGLACILLAVYLHLELLQTVGFFYAPLTWPVLTLVWLGVCSWLLVEALRTGSEGWYITLVLALIAVMLKLARVDLPSWEITSGFYYNGDYSLRDAIMRLIDFGALAGFFATAYALVAGRQGRVEPKTFFAGCALGTLLVYSTLELNTFLHVYLDGMRYGGISILWSVFALVLLLVGIVRHARQLRYVGLALFSIVVVKVFFVDLAQLDSFYRIIAFIVLGVLVLAASFAYLKFRESFAIDPVIATPDPEVNPAGRSP